MSRHHHALDARRWAMTRRQTFERDGHRCVRCGRAGKLECHHPEPLDEGGDPYSLANTETLCVDCHIEHHRPEPSETARKWAALVDELRG